MDSSARAKAAVDLLGHEPVAARQPSFGLHEVQEKHPCELKEGQAVAIFGLHRNR
jgi:hypothetical protein